MLGPSTPTMVLTRRGSATILLVLLVISVLMSPVTMACSDLAASQVKICMMMIHTMVLSNPYIKLSFPAGICSRMFISPM